MSAGSEGNAVRDGSPAEGTNRGVTSGHILSVMRRRARIILICTFAAGLAALAFSLLQEQKYEASASLLFREPKFGLNIFGEQTASAPTQAGTGPGQDRNAAGVAWRSVRPWRRSRADRCGGVRKSEPVTMRVIL